MWILNYILKSCFAIEDLKEHLLKIHELIIKRSDKFPEENRFICSKTNTLKWLCEAQHAYGKATIYESVL